MQIENLKNWLFQGLPYATVGFSITLIRAVAIKGLKKGRSHCISLGKDWRKGAIHFLKKRGSQWALSHGMITANLMGHVALSRQIEKIFKIDEAKSFFATVCSCFATTIFLTPFIVKPFTNNLMSYSQVAAQLLDQFMGCFLCFT